MLLCCDRTVCTCSLYRRANVPVYIRATPQSACTEYVSRPRRACTVWMQHLCLLCFRWVDHFLMPSDKHHGSHHRQVSSRVVHNSKHTHYAVEEHNARYDMNRSNSQEMCHTWPLNWTLLVFGMYSIVIYPMLLRLLVCQIKKKAHVIVTVSTSSGYLQNSIESILFDFKTLTHSDSLEMPVSRSLASCHRLHFCNLLWNAMVDQWNCTGYGNGCSALMYWS